MVKIMEHPIKMDDFGDTTIFGNFHIIHLVESEGSHRKPIEVEMYFFHRPIQECWKGKQKHGGGPLGGSSQDL